MMKPPKKIPHKLEAHGHVRIDDFYWMRERDSKDVLEFLRGENERTTEAMRPVAKLENKLYLEMRARIKEDDSSVPRHIAGYFYYSRYNRGQEYPLHCRKKGSLEAPEEIILDENELAAAHDYFQVAALEPSPNHRYLAFAVDVVGRRIYDIRFKDLHTGKLLADQVQVASPSLAWALDNKTLFFVRQDQETLREYQVYRFVMGEAAQPELVYEEQDTTFSVSLDASKSNQRLFMAISKRDSSEWRVLDAAQPRGEWRIVQTREEGHEYGLADGGDEFYILTNWQAENFRVMKAALDAKDKREWKEVIAHDPKLFREGLDVYAHHFVVEERANGLSRLRVVERTTGKSRELSFPDASYEVSLMPLPDYHSPVLRFAYDSMVQPPSVFEEDFRGAERVLRKRREVPGFNPSLYETERLWATAKDGVKVPVSIVHRKGLKLDGSHPLLLYGYGSYGLSTTVNFWSGMYSLIDRGFVFAQAHIRGGSEMGRQWYEQGRLKNKMNTFTDFIACAEKLIAEAYTSSEHLHIMGGSAGGLLMGAVMNLRPELFKSVSAGVPFVDVLTTMLDETIPLTTGEYKEWGDPRIKEEYEYMRRYSPYDNLKAAAYPHMLVTTGYHDSQVQYWEPAKWVARLRELKTDSHLLLLYTEFEAGHSGASGRFEALKLLAKELAFILMVEGIFD